MKDVWAPNWGGTNAAEAMVQRKSWKARKPPRPTSDVTREWCNMWLRLASPHHLGGGGGYLSPQDLEHRACSIRTPVRTRWPSHRSPSPNGWVWRKITHGGVDPPRGRTASPGLGPAGCSRTHNVGQPRCGCDRRHRAPLSRPLGCSSWAICRRIRHLMSGRAMRPLTRGDALDAPDAFAG